MSSVSSLKLPAVPSRNAAMNGSWALLLSVFLVAIPSLAVLKVVLLASIFAWGTWRGDFGNRGWLIGALAVLSLAIANYVALLNNVSPGDRLNQTVRIASFYGVFAGLNYLRRSLLTLQAMDKTCFAIASLMALIKIGMWAAVAFGGYSLETVMDFFGFETVSLLIGMNLFRLQFPGDFVCLFLIACYTGGRSRQVDLLFLLTVGIVIFLSFSRFIFLCFFVGMAVRSIWLRRMDVITGFGIAIVCLVFALFSNELVERFVGEGSQDSDETRVEQVQALAGDIALHPVFGRGIGGAVPGYTRSETLPFSYEAQWYATVMQLGWVGTLLLIGIVATIALRRVRRWRARLCLLILLLLWVMAGFTNPFITSLGSAVGLALARQRAFLS